MGIYTSSHNHGSQNMGPSNSRYLSNIAIFHWTMIMGEKANILPLHFVDFLISFLYYLFMVNVARQTSAGLTKNHHSPNFRFCRVGLEVFSPHFQLIQKKHAEHQSIQKILEDFAWCLTDRWDDCRFTMIYLSHRIHVWYIYLHLPYFTIKNNQM